MFYLLYILLTNASLKLHKSYTSIKCYTHRQDIIYWLLLDSGDGVSSAILWSALWSMKSIGRYLTLLGNLCATCMASCDVLIIFSTFEILYNEVLPMECSCWKLVMYRQAILERFIFVRINLDPTIYARVGKYFIKYKEMKTILPVFKLVNILRFPKHEFYNSFLQLISIYDVKSAHRDNAYRAPGDMFHLNLLALRYVNGRLSSHKAVYAGSMPMAWRHHEEIKLNDISMNIILWNDIKDVSVEHLGK